MADIFDNESSKLLCDESNDLCFDDDDDDSTIIDYDGVENLPLENYNQGSVFNRSSSDGGGGGGGPCLPIQSDEYFDVMMEKEIEYLPKDDYLMRLRSGELELSIRREAFDWISKAHVHYNFGPISFCLSINYLDRFLSACDLPKDKAWGVQLLAVTCLSIAIKMEETDTPPSIELQVGEPKFLFEAKTIQRMELLVLSTLRWKMSAITPFSYIDFFFTKINHGHHHQQSLHSLLNRSIPLISSTTRGIDFLEFKPSEIAAAVAMSIAFSGEEKQIQPVNVDDDAISFFTHLQKGRVVKCMELIKDLSHMTVNLEKGIARSGSISGLLPYSPIGVLDGVACFSYKSGCDDSLALGSCAPNSSTSPVTKRMKLDPKPPLEQPSPPPPPPARGGG